MVPATSGLPEILIRAFPDDIRDHHPGADHRFLSRARQFPIRILAFTALWLLIVYIPVAHWIWGGGWLAGLGTLDFAGGIVVHTTAGVSALVAAILIGQAARLPPGLSSRRTDPA